VQRLHAHVRQGVCDDQLVARDLRGGDRLGVVAGRDVVPKSIER